VAIHLKRLDHVNVSVADLIPARRFYGEILGLNPAPRPADLQRDGAWYQLGPVQLHLSVEEAANGAASKRHVAFEVESVADARAALTSAGLPFQEGHPVPGVERIFVRDPSGNRIELYQPLV